MSDHHSMPEMIREKEIIVCCGAGGVGKTSVSAALALSAARQGAIRSPVDPVVQILEMALERLPVIRPCHAVDTGRRVALQRIIRHPKQIDIDMGEERGEPERPILSCGFSYAAQRL